MSHRIASVLMGHIVTSPRSLLRNRTGDQQSRRRANHGYDCSVALPLSYKDMCANFRIYSERTMCISSQLSGLPHSIYVVRLQWLVG